MLAQSNHSRLWPKDCGLGKGHLGIWGIQMTHGAALCHSPTFTSIALGNMNFIWVKASLHRRPRKVSLQTQHSGKGVGLQTKNPSSSPATHRPSANLSFPLKSYRDFQVPSSRIKTRNWDFPGSPMVKTLHFHCRGQRFSPWLGN